MLLTLILSLTVILSVLLMLYSAVALIQKKALFPSAPKDIQAVIRDRKKERFKGARILGVILLVISMLGFAGAFLYGAIDGIHNDFSVWQFFLRFSVIFYIYKTFDIICLDWLLLTKLHFFQHYYPETNGCEGYRKFGFNRKSQIMKIILFPFISFAAALICRLFA
ncbi:MAG: hypothetical protein IJQ50_01305 [Clostridia bacterium]|nr:hypothetical protein [Clostridia bacterium]